MYIQAKEQVTLNMAEKFIAAAPEQAAKFFETLATHETLQFLSGLKAQHITIVLENMEPAKAAPILRRLPLKQAAHITSSFNINFAARALAALPPHHKSKIENELPKAFAQELKDALSYPKGSAGEIMTSDFTVFKTDSSVESIVKKFKNMPRKKVPMQTYVLDKSGRLAGVIRTIDLVFYQQEAMAGSIMQTDFDKTNPGEKAEQALEILHNSSLTELPVINEKNILIGVITQQTKNSPKDKKNIFSIFNKG
ncbi:Putative Mg/Co/Ni transporter [Elusimicrobium minutum Pei191]|uniref:Putative Mg/Co/Ni transporter n=1 Tax=Elusimicrobium minutum (strain Pei191) TaxID=445932 RepID=B2KCI9_ELUMP|nr:CBS domain-containing protein [Elusimicrobium minutum]ACC98110.1 Putative Mg/Co/Ni transporter [Elusimicrobium minutum Pei191]